MFSGQASFAVWVTVVFNRHICRPITCVLLGSHCCENNYRTRFFRFCFTHINNACLPHRACVTQGRLVKDFTTTKPDQNCGSIEGFQLDSFKTVIKYYPFLGEVTGVDSILRLKKLFTDRPNKIKSANMAGTLVVIKINIPKRLLISTANDLVITHRT